MRALYSLLYFCVYLKISIRIIKINYRDRQQIIVCLENGRGKDRGAGGRDYIE